VMAISRCASCPNASAAASSAEGTGGPAKRKWQGSARIVAANSRERADAGEPADSEDAATAGPPPKRGRVGAAPGEAGDAPT
jgi:hypothetical protein